MAFGYGFDNDNDQNMYGGLGGYQYKQDIYNSNNDAYDNYSNSFDKYESIITKGKIESRVNTNIKGLAGRNINTI